MINVHKSGLYRNDCKSSLELKTLTYIFPPRLTSFALLLLDQSPAVCVIGLTKSLPGAVRGTPGAVTVGVTGVGFVSSIRLVAESG